MADLTKQDVADLARVVALLADAVAQNLSGQMRDEDTAANVRGLHAMAANIHNRLV